MYIYNENVDHDIGCVYVLPMYACRGFTLQNCGGPHIFGRTYGFYFEKEKEKKKERFDRKYSYNFIYID